MNGPVGSLGLVSLAVAAAGSLSEVSGPRVVGVSPSAEDIMVTMMSPRLSCVVMVPSRRWRVAVRVNTVGAEVSYRYTSCSNWWHDWGLSLYTPGSAKQNLLTPLDRSNDPTFPGLLSCSKC